MPLSVTTTSTSFSSQTTLPDEPLELRAVDEQDQLLGTLDQPALSGDEHHVRLHDALQRRPPQRP